MGYALRHVMELEATFAQYYRVLRPGGRVLILEVTKPAGAIGNFFFRLYFGRIYPALTQLFTRSQDAREMMAYYWETMDACVQPDAVLTAMRMAEFTDVKRTRLCGMFSEYSGVKR
jgi:demethylmenaquinone methyltransferase/2-methoxy-6-polyprenyl-1,4-benzoquinol methylase